jgi:hypothetical protein
MGGDGGGLRDDVQVWMADDLMPAPGGRLAGGGDKAEQDVPRAVPRRAGAGGPLQVEGTGTVVQQRWVITTQSRRQAGVALVTR